MALDRPEHRFDGGFSLPKELVPTHMASKVPFSAAARALMYAPELWSTEGGSRHAIPGEKKFTNGMVYRVYVEQVGSEDMPVGRNRCWSYIGPADNCVEMITVHIPGFAHTHVIPTWYAEKLAKLAYERQCAFVIVDPDGRAVEGFDGADGVGGVPLEKSLKDIRSSVKNVLEASVNSSCRGAVLVALSGHSLGGRSATDVGSDMVQHPQKYPGNLHQVGLWASVGARTLEDLCTLQYLWAVTPYLGKAALGWKGKGSKGLDFALKDLQRLFYGAWGNKPGVLEAAAVGLNLGGARSFFEISLGAGNYADVALLAQAVRARGGFHVVIPKQDGIFGRGEKDSLQAVPGALVHFLNAPHCPLVFGLERTDPLALQIGDLHEQFLIPNS